MASQINKASTRLLGFLQALEVTAYCAGVGFFMWNDEKIFQNFHYFLGPVMLLLLFSVSALICGLIVFYRPYKLFFEDRKKEAVELVLYTTLWLFIFFLIVLSLVILLG